MAEESKQDISFFDIFYQTVNTFKNHITAFVGIFLLEFLLSMSSLYISNFQDDATKIVGAISDVVFGVIIFVIFANIFYAKSNDLEFSLKKSFWDLPTYLYYELALGVLMIVSIILLFFPFLYVVYAFSFVPIVAILFDYNDEGVFTKTKKLVFSNHSVYICLLILSSLSSLITYGASTIIGYFPANIMIYIFVSMSLAFVAFFVSGLILTFFNEITSEERDEFFGKFANTQE